MTKRWSKKLASPAMGVMLASAMLLSACSSKEDNTSGNAGAASSAPATLKVEVFDRGNTPSGYTISDSYLTRLVQERFGKPNNINVEFVPVPRSEEIQKLNVLMASKSEVPDIVFTYDSGTFNRYAEQGGLTDLTELIDQYAPNLKEFLGEDTLAYGQYKGQQFALPGRRLVLGKYAGYIRQDWLDKLGLPVPQTTEELYTTLKAFKDKDPGGTGGKVIPFGVSLAAAQVEPLIWSFIEPLTDEQRYTLTQQLGSSDYPTLLPGFKDALKFMNKLYNEGLMSKDFGLDKDKKQLWQNLQNGQIGFYTEDAGEPYFTWNDFYENLQSNVPGASMTPVDVFTNAEGKHAKPAYAPNAMYVMIPKSSSNAVAALKYLDWMASGTNLFDVQFGVENENYTLVDGVPVVKADATQEVTDRLYNFGDIAIIVNGKFAGDDAKNEAAYIAQTPEKFQADMRKSVEISNVDKIQPVRFDHPIEAEAKYGTTLADKFQEIIVKLTMIKPEQFDSTYDSMIKDYMSSGGQAIQDERTAAYKEMTSK
ncbi:MULTISPECIES: extracellular solute-binding protein [Paenibacillus]|uniref:ABC transporter substrate-binding protein n=1 Tax=Paenibacillus borealis TaxID=160799 RepID=A0ABX3H5Q9_PAEBO|nr:MULTISPECIES: extracellular solute-binding protein [Paenibacillus]OMD45378.1 ABC transporter substrate-binding protein [Paenibacillus borealis]